MHPRTEELLTYLRDARAALVQALDRVPEAQRQVKPDTGQWSAAEILEHLAIVEARIAGFVSRHVTSAKSTGLARETSEAPVLPSLDLQDLTDRRVKRVAGEISQPTGTLRADEAWARLTSARAALESAMREGDGWALETLSEPHHRLGAMNLYQWIAFAGAHELRHAAQLAELGERLVTKPEGLSD